MLDAYYGFLFFNTSNFSFEKLLAFEDHTINDLQIFLSKILDALYDFQVLKQLSKAGVTAGFIDGHRGFFVGLFFLTKKPERKK